MRRDRGLRKVRLEEGEGRAINMDGFSFIPYEPVRPSVGQSVGWSGIISSFTPYKQMKGRDEC